MTGPIDRQSGSGVSRRQLASGVAWSVPAIGLVAAAPLVAASPTCPAVTFELSAVTVGGSPGHRITVTNTGSSPVPAGSAITWDFLYGAGISVLTIGPTVGVALQNGATFAVTWSSTVTISTTVRDQLDSGMAASWDFTVASSFFESNVTLSFGGTNAASCSSASACLSTFDGRIGSSCPGA